MTSAGWRAPTRSIPPNVFPFQHDGLAAKYAVLSEADFHRLNGPETRNVSVWARFAQPSRLVWAADEAARDNGDRGGRARRADPARRAPGGSRARPPLDWWRRAFALTYSAELRAERKGRSGSVVDADRRALSSAFPPRRSRRSSRGAASGGWARRRVEGKLLSVARLAKASATYAGGADYIVWKINRHAGTDFALKPWQRRHPLLAAISLLPRLLRSGAIR